MARSRKPPIPITVVAGPRGAGKTTLISRLLGAPEFANAAVIVNDFGEVAITGAAIETASDGFIALGSGCVCCSVRGALTDGLEALLRDLDNRRLAHLGRVVIEADAEADPGAILSAVSAHPYLSLRYAADGIIVVLDATAARRDLAERAATARQVATADVVLLSRAGEAGPAVHGLLRALNPSAEIADAATIAPERVAGHGPFDPALDDADAWLAAATPAADLAPMAGEAARIHNFTVVRARPLPFAALDLFLEYLAALQANNLIRVRGAVGTAEGEAAIVDGSSGTFRPPLIVDQAGAPRVRFVVTAVDLDQAGFEAYLDAFLGEARIDTPDRAALTENPLAIPGFSARSGR